MSGFDTIAVMIALGASSYFAYGLARINHRCFKRIRRLKQALSDIYYAPNTTEYVRDVAINALKEGGSK